MPLVNRRVTYKLYPDAKQHAALEKVCDLHRGLYNAAPQGRVAQGNCTPAPSQNRT